jgi:protein gp37
VARNNGRIQRRFDFRWERLKKVPAAIHFISYEPSLGPVRLPRKGCLPDWLISGGEAVRVPVD